LVKNLKTWLKVLKDHVKFLKVWLKSVKKGQNPKSHVLMVLKSWSKKVTFRMVFFKKSCNWQSRNSCFFDVFCEILEKKSGQLFVKNRCFFRDSLGFCVFQKSSGYILYSTMTFFFGKTLLGHFFGVKKWFLDHLPNVKKRPFFSKKTCFLGGVPRKCTINSTPFYSTFI
jgi:hypothetical protein